MFRHTPLIPDEGATNPTEHFIDIFYSWHRVADCSHELGDRLPRLCVAIGADLKACDTPLGQLEIVLALRAEDFGATYSWVRNWASWGSAENDYLCPSALSFSAFVAALFDDDEKNGHDYWHTPRGEFEARVLRA